MRENYKGYAWKLDDLRELCNSVIQELLINKTVFKALYFDKGISNITVRYIYDENKFGYATMGDFFFIDDCMYIISDDDFFKDGHNEDIPGLAENVFRVKYERPEKYITRVIFAGVRTPFRDNRGDRIYTGDIVVGNKYYLSGVCAFPPLRESDPISIPDDYGIMLDNHMLPLRDCKSIIRIGTIYFKIEKFTTEIDSDRIIRGGIQHNEFNREFLICAGYTPSFYQETWKYIAFKKLGVEYDWRR